MRRYFTSRAWGETWRILLAFLVGAFYYTAVLLTGFVPVDGAEPEPMYGALWMYVLDPGLGLVSLALIPFRRRWPVAIPLIATTLGAVAPTAAGSALVVLASLATTRRWRPILLVCVWSVLVASAGDVLLSWSGGFAEGGRSDPRGTAITQALALAAVVGFGAAIGARRDVIASLRAQVASAEREASRRLEQARATERARIAREMHDVLAHRISVIAMHAGALSYRADLPREQVKETADLLRDNADHAITELRAVLGVLRGTDEPEQPRAPQPDLRALPGLVTEFGSGGTEVALDLASRSIRGAVPLDPDRVPAPISRAAYRIVQESLTNARKHAPGMPATVRLRGGPEVGLDIEVVNAAAPYQPDLPPAPGSGLGLMGLAERAQLSGGRFSSGVDRAGQFRVRAWLPWESPATQPTPGPAEAPAPDSPPSPRQQT